MQKGSEPVSIKPRHPIMPKETPAHFETSADSVRARSHLHFTSPSMHLIQPRASRIALDDVYHCSLTRLGGKKNNDVDPLPYLSDSEGPGGNPISPPPQFSPRTISTRLKSGKGTIEFRHVIILTTTRSTSAQKLHTHMVGMLAYRMTTSNQLGCPIQKPKIHFRRARR